LGRSRSCSPSAKSVGSAKGAAGCRVLRRASGQPSNSGCFVRATETPIAAAMPSSTRRVSARDSVELPASCPEGCPASPSRLFRGCPALSREHDPSEKMLSCVVPRVFRSGGRVARSRCLGAVEIHRVGHQLNPRSGRLLTAAEVVLRLRAEFAYVDADPEEGHEARAGARRLDRGASCVDLPGTARCAA
jgi:hypothetical protein